MKYIDTNVFLQFLVYDREKSDGLVDFFDKLQSGEEKVFCLDLIFFQVIFVLKSVYNIKKDEIISIMLQLLEFDGLRMRDKRVMERTLELWKTHPGDIIDCYIVANMEKKNDKVILSYDRGMENLGVKRIEP